MHAGNAQVYLFQNYALLQRPPDSCLKALDKFAWQSFGLEAEVLYQPSNACVHLDMQERQFLHCQRFSIESCCVLPKSHVISCRKSQLHVFLPAVIAVCIQKIALPLLHLTDEFTTLQCQTPLCGPLDPLFLPATQPHLAATQLLSFSFSPACTYLCFMQAQALPSGAITMTFGAKSDALAQDISAFVIHLFTHDPKQDPSTGKSPALAAVTEVLPIYRINSNILCSYRHH